MADTPILDKVIKDLDESRTYHETFVSAVDRRYKSYRGIVDPNSDAAQWRSQLFPPYVFQVVETITGNMIDDRISFRVRPRPQLLSPPEIEQHKKAAQSLEYLLRYQLDLDHFDEKQRPFALQNSITGLSVAKPHWRFSMAPVRRQRIHHEPVLHPDTGEQIASTPILRDAEQIEVIHDDPTVEIVDVRDFMWHEAAVSLERAKWVAHRIWMTFDELKTFEKQGLYSNVDQLKESRSFGDDFSSRDDAIFRRNRTKDQIEVIEYWTDDRCVTIANRKVLLSDRPNPFWHKQKPFVVCSSMPDLFTIPGVSDVEIVEELQHMLWAVMNQRLDNLALINNAIILMRSDLDDPESFEFAPGEKWMVDDPQQVVMWTPNPVPAEVSVAAENLIKGDIQNITGGMPFVAGSDSQTVDNKTATGVSIVTTLAQKRLAAKKQHFSNAYRRIAEQWIALNQQFIRDSKAIQIVGHDGDLTNLTVKPEEIQGRFSVEVDSMSDSFMRQERRAEGQALVTVAAQLAPVAQAVGTPINLRAYIEDWLKSYDVIDVDRYFSAQPQPQLMAQPGAAGGTPPQGGGPPSPGGTTAPEATAPQISPSNVNTMAPSSFMQRALALQGSPRGG